MKSNKEYTMNRLIRHIAFMTLPLLFVACTEVNLCEGEEHPHLAELSFRFDWGADATPEGRPDTMLVMANRIINTWRAGFLVEVPEENGGIVNEGKTKFGKLVSTVNESTDEETSDEESTESDTNSDTPSTDDESDSNKEGDSDTSDEPTDEEDASETDDAETLSEEGEESTTDENTDESADTDSDTDEPTENTEEENGNEDPTESEETSTPEKPDNKIRVKEGDFQFIAINGNYDECEIERIEEFQTDPMVKAKELYVRYKTYEKSDESLEVFGRSWIDYNPYGHFIVSAMKPTWYALVPMQTIRTGEKCLVEFEPECITQKYTIKFKIEKESGVKIDTIVGVLGGIPQRYGLTTRYIDVTTTNKMIFVPQADYDNNDSQTALECTGNINAIGVVRSKGSSYTQGPGVLQLCIYASTKRNGQIVSKTFYAIINLYNTISEAKPLVAIDDGTHVVQNGKEILLDIKSLLRIDKNGIVENANEDNSMDRWKKAGTFHVDI